MLLKKNIQPQKGQILILSVVLLPLLLMITILLIEIGNIYIQQSELQDIADAAAVAFAKDGEPATVKKLLEKNDVASSVELYTSKKREADTDTEFYIKLEDSVRPIFFKMSDGSNLPALKIYSAASKDRKLISLPTTEPTWAKYTGS